MNGKALSFPILLFFILSAVAAAEPVEGPHLVFEIYLQQPELDKAAMLKHEIKSITGPPFGEQSLDSVWRAAVETVLRDVDIHYGKQAQSILPSGDPDVIESVTLITWSLYVDPFAPWQLIKAAGSLRAPTDMERELLVRDGASLCRFYPDWIPKSADNAEPTDLTLADPSLVTCLARARNALQKGQSARVLFLHGTGRDQRLILAETSLHRPL